MLATIRRSMWFATLVGFVLVPQLAALAAETFQLASAAKAGDLMRVKVQVDAGGDLKVVDKGKVRPLKMNLSANLEYDELLLSNEQDMRLGVRYYDKAEAAIKIEQGGISPKLRDGRRLIGVDCTRKRGTLFSPNGPLTRDELELVDLQANSLLLDGLLPTAPVEKAGTWKIPAESLVGLLCLDAVSNADVQATLKEVMPGKTANVEFTGAVDGALNGVATEIEVKGKYQFDFAAGRINYVALLIKEKRSVGHVATGTDLTAKITLTIAPLAESKHLSNEALGDLPLAPSPELTLLSYESKTGEFRLLHDRRWHTVNDEANSLSMRLVDRGDLISQCNISPIAKAAPGKHQTLAKFQEEIKLALGDKFSQFTKGAQSQVSSGYFINSVTATGKVSELPIVWNYYLVAGPDGRQAGFAFTLEPDLVERFAQADLALVESLEFIDPPQAATAQRPTSAPVKK